MLDSIRARRDETTLDDEFGKDGLTLELDPDCFLEPDDDLALDGSSGLSRSSFRLLLASSLTRSLLAFAHASLASWMEVSSSRKSESSDGRPYRALM